MAAFSLEPPFSTAPTQSSTEQHRAAQSRWETRPAVLWAKQSINTWLFLIFLSTISSSMVFFQISSCFRLGQMAPIPRAKRPNCLLIGWRFLIHLKRALAIFPHSDPIHRIKAGLRPDEAHQINRFETDASLI